MGLFDKIPETLKKIFGTNQTNANAELKNSMDNNTIKLFDFSRKTEQKIEVKEGGQLVVINLGKCSDQEKQLIASDLLKPAVLEGSTILKQNLVPKTKQLEANLPQDEDEQLLGFYRGKLSPEYIEALEMSLIVM